MKKNLNENIERIKKIMLLKEGDIFGIDELVYNPLTKKGGSIGHGYDKGKKVEGITWGGHDNHLHVAFTDKNVAMKVIDKADNLGLKTTENPYAKQDPNNKVDKVHTNSSFHYQNFDGEPKVGKAVDISGEQSKIEELIKWIETEYAGTTSDSQENETSSNETDEKVLLDKILNSEYNGVKVKDLIDSTTPDNFLVQLISTLSKIF